MKANNMLKTYIRNEDKSPVGIAVVIKEGSDLFFGYSLTSPKDQFNKKLGTKIAVERAKKYIYSIPFVTDRGDKVIEAYANLRDRAERYFK